MSEATCECGHPMAWHIAHGCCAISSVGGCECKRAPVVQPPDIDTLRRYHGDGTLNRKEVDQLFAALRSAQARNQQLEAALQDLWLWASEQRYHLDSDPVPDGVGAQVLAVLEPSAASSAGEA